MKRKIVSIFVCLCLLVSVLTLASCTNGNQNDGELTSTQAMENDLPDGSTDSIVILYENDVHCAIDGYSKLAAMKQELASSYDHVGVVSSGDFVQGGTMGAVSKGEYIINLMNKVGYDAIALGNHEFDYRLPRLVELNEMSNAKFLSCNLTRVGEDTSYFDAYTIVSYGDVEIAYIGITTPETIHSSSPAQFKNEAGEFMYTFNEAKLYELVQASIDAAEEEGADYVIALSHIGYSEAENLADITDIIENTDGLDVVLDAHTHSVIEEMTVKDKSGDDVVLSSTGTKFEYIGKLTITEDGLDTELVKTATYEKTDESVDAYIAQINESYAELGDRKIGESSVALNTHDGDIRLVRNSETALGNLCSDALRVMTGADVSFVNGGGLRAPIEAGDVTFNDIFSVFPFNNQVVTAEVTGQILLDMLEMSVMSYPDEDGSFPHVSGVTFSVNTAIPTSVKMDENGFFTEVDGAYRVYGVRVLDPESGTYKALELDGRYVLAGFNYFLVDFGGGMSMLKDATILDAEGTLDVEMLEQYIVDHLGGVIGDEYAQPQGRISFTDGNLDQMYADSIKDAETADVAEIEELVMLTKDSDMVTWNEDGTKVLLLSWHQYPESYPAGASFTCSYGEVWVFTDKEICAWYDANGMDVTDWELRLEQLIGLPTSSEYTHVTAFWVDLDELVRPAFNPDVTEPVTADDLDGSELGDLKEWFDGNAEWSYSEDGQYPWTRLGYTYDWASGGTEYGLTEFIILEGSTVEVEWTKTTADFVAWMQAN